MSPDLHREGLAVPSGALQRHLVRGGASHRLLARVAARLGVPSHQVEAALTLPPRPPTSEDQAAARD